MAIARHEKYTLGPLKQMIHSDWYIAAFRQDYFLTYPILCPVLLSEDNLPTGARYESLNNKTERDYWIHMAFGRFTGPNEAWEVLPVWWGSEEVSLIASVPTLIRGLISACCWHRHVY